MRRFVVLVVGLSFMGLGQAEFGLRIRDVIAAQGRGSEGAARLDSIASATKVVNWRSEGKINFQIQPVAREGRVGMKLNIWGFGTPDREAGAPGSRPEAPKNPMTKVGRLVASIPVSSAPANGFDVKLKDLLPWPTKLVTLGGGSSAAPGISASVHFQNLKDALAEIEKSGTLNYTAQLVADDGGASNWVVFQYGEPKPSGAAPGIEIETQAGTPEFPATWGQERTFSDSSLPLNLRFSGLPSGSKVWLQIARDSFDPAWSFFGNIKNEVVWREVTGGKIALPAKDLATQKYPTVFVARVVCLTPQGDLAAMPSGQIKLTKQAVQVVQPNNSGPEKKLSYTVELIGWEPAYLGDAFDQYRFVVGRKLDAKIEGNVTEIIGKAPAVGDKVFLPPSEPKKDDPWYKKVFKAVATVLDFIKIGLQQLITGPQKGAQILIYNLYRASAQGLGISNDQAVKTWNKATDVYLAPGQAVDYLPRYVSKGKDYVAAKILDDLDVKDPKTRSALSGHLRGVIESEISKQSYLSESSSQLMGLAPDPDFAVRPGLAYVRVKASQVAGLPADYRQEGPVIDLKVGCIWHNASLLGTSPQYADLFQRSFAGPTMASGETIILAIPLDWHWSYKSNKDSWMNSYAYAQQARYMLDGKEVKGDLVGKAWGTTLK